MIKGFVFGKFYPFHKGHEGLIQFALSKCDQLAVLICCSDLEKINGDIRKSWIENTFPNHPNITFIIYNYSEQDLPNTSESSLYVSEKWSAVFKELLPDYQLIVTSEPYGKYVANFMKIANIDFDIARICYPISGSLLRKNIFDYWDYLPPSVKKHFTVKVAVLGTESTGKSSISKALSHYFNGSLVEEAARDIIPNSKQFSTADLYRVISEQTKSIEHSAEHGKPLLVMDTDIHITLSYGRYKLKEELTINEQEYLQHKAHLYLYLTNDFAFEQDGTRLEEEDRNLLDASHRRILKEKNIPYKEISGDWNARLQQCIHTIQEYLSDYSQLLYHSE